MAKLPHWCRPPSLFVGRERLVEDVVDALGVGPVTLTGPPGCGATTTAGAVAQRLVELGRADRAVAVRMDGCCNVSDAIRAIGYALHLAMPGDPATVRSTLREGPVTAVILDDADLSPNAARQVLAITGKSPVIATGREPVIGTTFEVDPLGNEAMAPLLPTGTFASEFRGLPLLTRLPPATDPVDPWSCIEHIPDGSELLADIPMGLDDEGTQPSGELRPFLLPVRGRLVMRRSVREILGAGHRPSAQTLGAVVRDRLPELHKVASDVDPLVSHEDIILLRTAAEQIQEPDLRSLAGAAAARMMLRAFQPSDALALTQVLVAIRLPPTARGLLRWVEGDTYLALGSESDAQSSWSDAARALSAANRADIVSTMSRAIMDRLLARESVALANQWLENVEGGLPGRSDRLAFADAKRLTGHAAYLDGEEDAALARYAEASASLRGGQSPPQARAAVAIARATAHLERGDLERCHDQITRAEDDAGEVPGLVAAIETLKAEAALRENQTGQAFTSAERAAAGFRWTGDVAGLSRVHRLLGDAHALSGDRTSAVSAYREAVRLAVRLHDLPAVRAGLARIALVEQEGVGGAHVDEAWAQLNMAGGLKR